MTDEALEKKVLQKFLVEGWPIEEGAGVIGISVEETEAIVRKYVKPGGKTAPACEDR